jgi:N,N'-diacetyllegionaminate synthase
MSVFVIAEVGSTHDGSFGNAMRAVDSLSDSGANAVKFQTHVSAAETLTDAPMPPYFKGEPRYEYFERTAFTLDQWNELAAHCEENGMEFLSSPFSIAAVETLEKTTMKRYKIPSGEVSNLPMLDVIGRTGKPVLLSSGMSSWAEIDAAVETLRKHHDNVTVLQCTSAYPCEPADVGLNIMLEMKERYGLSVGLSDHTKSIFAPIVATTLGAQVVEKHFTLSNWMYGSDAWNSLEPAAFAQMVEGIRTAETILNNPVDKNEVAKFQVMKDTFEKSLVAAVSIQVGAEITRDMIAEKKPGTGISASQLEKVIGRKATKDIAPESMLEPQDFEPAL